MGKQGRKGGPKEPVLQVGIVSWGGRKCADRSFPGMFQYASELHLSYLHLQSHESITAGVYTRISSVANFISETVCERTGELCNTSKSGKQSKGDKSAKGTIRRLDTKSGKHDKEKYDACTKVMSTYAPTTTTLVPTITPAPSNPLPTYLPTMPWPTWMPTAEARGKLFSSKL